MNSVLSEIDKYIEAREKKKLDEAVIDCHRPSSISKCIRQMYYQWTKEPISNYPDATIIYKLKVGDWIHAGIQEILKEMYGKHVLNETKFIVEYKGLRHPVIGHIDSVLYMDDSYDGVEIKTTFGKGIVNIAREKKPKSEHIEQIKCYMICANIEKFFLPYYGRDSFYRTEFIIEMTGKERKEFKEYMINKFKRIEYHVDNLIIPEREFVAVISDGEIKKEVQRKNVKYKSDWQCALCYYRSTCYAEELASFDEYLTKEDYK